MIGQIELSADRRKHYEKIIIILALMTVFSLVACSGGKSPSESKENDGACAAHADKNNDASCDKCGWVLGDVDERAS